jgi:hypothetical protein
MSGTPILISADSADSLIPRPIRLTDRVRARVSGAALDQRLAAGHSPESAPLLAVRARQIVSLRSRRAVARGWENLLRVARRPRGIYSPAIPVNRGQIVAAEPAIRELATLLRAPLPVTAQGAAKARLPLTDPTGPVYSHRGGVPLVAVVEDAIAHLDPALPLLRRDPSDGW